MSGWARRSAAERLALAILAMTACSGAAHAVAPEMTFRVDPGVEGLPIRRIIVTPRNIYDPLPEGRLRPLYRLANSLHIRTRRSTVESQILLEPGDRWTLERGRETARGLRALGILEPSRIEARRAGDSVDVSIETHDDWTTQPEFAIESANGDAFASYALVERNLLGLGKEIRFAYRETPEGVTRSAAYDDPNVAGSRLRLQVHGGTGSEGSHEGFEAAVPFYAEDAPYSYGARWGRATSVAHLFESDREMASFDRRLEESEVFWGRGVRKNGDIYRLTGYFTIRERRYGPSQLQPGAPPEFGGGEENLHLRRFSAEGRWWRPFFQESEGIDRLGGIEDIDLGTSVRLGLGFSPAWLGSSADEGWVMTRIEGGVQPTERTFGQVSLDASSRIRRRPLDLLARGKARWVTQYRPGRTLVAGAYASASRQPPREYQEVLGGLAGLRAFPVRALAGDQAWRLNVEHRWWLGHDYFAILSLGAVAFYDAGRTWGAGAVGGWRQDVGVGLRFALPRSGQDRVARIDIAWPVGSGEDSKPVFSVGSGQAF